MKGAFIGFGQVVELGHVPAFTARNDIFSIEAVSDPVPDRLKKAGEIYPRARLYPDYKTMLSGEKGLDFAVIASPPVYHPEHVLAALKRKLHVLCEKPLALKLRDLNRMKTAAQKADRCLFTVHNWKYAPPSARAIALAKEHAGNILHAQFHTLRQKPAASAGSVKSWRQDPSVSGGGIVVDHGWHAFYMVCALAGKKPVSVSARLEIPEAGAVDEVVTASIGFEDGSTGMVYLTWKSPARNNLGLIYGTDAVIEIHDSVVTITNSSGTQSHDTGDRLTAGSAHPAWMTPLLADFHGEITEPSKRGLNLTEAGYCLRLIEAAKKSHSLSGKQMNIWTAVK